MSKNLFFNRRFWQDQYITDLDPVEKLLFIYLVTNPHCALTGIYEVPLKVAAVETGIEAEMIKKIVTRFHKDGRVYNLGSWFCVKNYPRYQKFSGVKLERGILNELKAIPSGILLDFINLGYPIDTLSILSSDSDSVSDSESRLEKIKNIIMSWQKNRIGDDYLEYEVQADPDYKPKKKEAAVPNELLEVYNLFDNPARKVWHTWKKEREAAQVLLEAYGIETLRKRVARIKEESKKNDPLFPLISSPSQLLEKMPNVERYLGI